MLNLRFNLARATALVTLLLPWEYALAQSTNAPAPDAGLELQREQSRQEAQRLRAETNVDVQLQLPPADRRRLPTQETPCFPIRSIELSLAEQSTSTGAPTPDRYLEDLQTRMLTAMAGPDGTDSPTGRCLGQQGIAMVIKRAQDSALQSGLVTTRVVAQPQNLSAGVLGLTLMPGYVGEIRFENEQTPGVQLANSVPARAGDLLNLRDIEQGLENLKRVPTAEADIRIVPSAETAPINQSDLLVTYQQKRPARLALSMDDSGSKASGRYQTSTTLSLDNPFQLSDLFYITLNHDVPGGDGGNRSTRGTRGLTLHYSVPFSYWLLGTTYSSSSYYQSVAGRHVDYVYSGTSENSELSLARTLYRDAVRKTGIRLKAWQRRSRNFIDNTEINVQRRAAGGWELGLTHQDALGSSTLGGGLNFKRGNGDFDDMPAPEQAFGEGTSHFGRWTLDLKAGVPFKVSGLDMKYDLAILVQNNATPLSPQDRLAIGGRYSVRGFDGESALMGERGWTLRNDWSARLPGTAVHTYVGLDAGEVSGPSARRGQGPALSGAVAGLRGDHKSLKFDLFIGTALLKPNGFRTADTTAGASLTWTM